MKLLQTFFICIALLLFIVFMAYISKYVKEGLSPSPSQSPGSDKSYINDEFCAAINSIDTTDPTGLDAKLSTLTDPKLNTTFNENQKKILLGIKANQAIYQGQFLDIQKKLCNVYSKIKQINKKLPKDEGSIVVGTVGSCSYENADTQAQIKIDILDSNDPSRKQNYPNLSTPDYNDYAVWRINAVLPTGPNGDKGVTGPDGTQGKTGEQGKQGERGVRGNWAEKPTPVPENTMLMDYSNAVKKSFTEYSIY